ncbi:MAG: hypothetical protein LIQ30_01960 [Planctomycetes bacterium]|nr:hypothetical protein [Planctomycetota bacterium]MCD7895149.1 hypothetical protein [Planctomycetaceae bacterium]
MSVLLSHYARILQEKRIMYLPSCVVVEMMARLFSQVSQINLSGNLHNLMPDLLVLLRRMSTNLHATAESYRSDRIGFLVGSWKEDKLRARKLFFDLMSRLGYISELLGAVEKALLYRAIEEMSKEWAELDRLMEAKLRTRLVASSPPSESARQLRPDSLDGWRSMLVATAADLQTRSAEEPDLCLVLLCSEKARRALIDVIKAAAPDNDVLPDIIIAIHHQDASVSCPRCALLTEALQNSEPSEYRRSGSTSRKIRDSRRGVTIIRGRQPMPPSLAGISSR